MEDINHIGIDGEPIETAEVTSKPENDLRKAIEERMEQLRTQNLLLGAQSMCKVVLSKIYAVTNKPGKISMRAYERLIKDLVIFCETGLSRTVNLDGTTSPRDEKPAEETEE